MTGLRTRPVIARTEAEWDAANPVLGRGRIAFATDKGELRAADGVKKWSQLLGAGAQYFGARSYSSAEMTTSAARITTNQLPRIVLPNGVTTSVLIGPNGYPGYWLTHGGVIGFDIVNDDVAGGDIRWRVIARKWNSFGPVAAPTIALDSTQTVTGPAAGNMQTVTHNAWVNFDITGDPFGSLYAFELQRIGGDAADTHGGNIGLTEFVIARGTLAGP